MLKCNLASAFTAVTHHSPATVIILPPDQTHKSVPEKVQLESIETVKKKKKDENISCITVKVFILYLKIQTKDNPCLYFNMET